MNKLAKFFDRVLPPAKYSDGKNAKCVLYRFWAVLDITES